MEYVEKHPERVQKLRDNSNYFREQITAAGFKPLAGETPIVPIIVGETAAAIQMNFERLSISHDRLTWHDRMIGTFGLIVAVAIAAAALAFGLYLAGSALIGLLEKAAS